jgi:dTMP kinase|uniref:Thymidylate kinase n=1 Tax=Dictyoglomus turgidum TaxID=513050 RepID=A0A7C3SND2_9BACT
MEKSIFITFEGLDGSGKSTQISILKNYLEDKGIKVYVTREPGGTEVGEKIRSILLDPDLTLKPWTEAFLYIGSRVENTEKIKKKLQEGFWVICERYMDSTIAYQGYGRGLPINILSDLNRIATSNLIPHITFLIDIDPYKSLSRKKNFDRIERESLEFYDKVRKGYLEIAEREKERFVVISGERSIEEIRKDIISYLERKYI